MIMFILGFMTPFTIMSLLILFVKIREDLK